MPLPARVDTLDAVDEAFHGEYEEKGGEYVLQVEGIKEHPTVTGLARAYEAEKSKRSDLADRLKAFGDATPDDLEAMQSELEQLREAGGGDLISAEDLKALKERHKELSQKAKRAEELESRVDFYQKDYANRLKEEVRGSLAAAGVRPEALKAAAALIVQDYDARWEKTDEGMRPVVTGDLNGVPGDHELKEFVGEFVSGEGAIFLPPSGKSGSGAAPSSDNGARGSNVQVQDGMVRVDPSKVVSGEVTVTAD
jgi:hypothetical protein